MKRFGDLPSRSRRPSSVAIALLALLLLGLVIQGAVVAHAHTESGLYNPEHDSTLWAAARAAGPPPDALMLVITVVAAFLVVAQSSPHASLFRADAESRAPPA